MISRSVDRSGRLALCGLTGLAFTVSGLSCALKFPDYGVGGTSMATDSVTTTSTTSSGPIEPDGSPCASNDDCLNGHCLPSSGAQAHVCCSTDCTDMGPASCGMNGECDAGGSGCALYPTGTVCGTTAICNEGSLGADRCQAGSCEAADPVPCPGGLGCADAGSCKTSCVTSNDCADPNADCPAMGSHFCVQPAGDVCASDQECASEHCGTAGVGHCCKFPCQHIGEECGPTDCGGDGQCVFANPETPCGPDPSCSGTNLDSHFCDGTGQCSWESIQPCPDHLRCLDDSSCHTMCGPNSATGDVHCAPGYWCDGSGCQPARWDDDSACSRDAQCRSNDCTPGGTCVGVDCDFDNDGALRDDAHCGGTDCDDADSRAKPGQTAFFTTPRSIGGYDFDCDGVAEPALPTSCSICPGQATLVPPGEGGCGVTGQVWACFNFFGFCGNNVQVATATQSCH